MLKVENIDVYYGAIHAIRDVSFEVREGEIVTLIGANGAGKSTILKTVSGILAPKTGTVNFLGKKLNGTPTYMVTRMGLSHVPEGRRIFQQLSVEENLEMGGFTMNKDEIPSLIEHVYDRFPRLRERHTQIASTLSGGERQMLAIGRALMSRPRLMMLDEPSMGLAPILVEQIFDIIKELNDSGVTILLVEQNANMALKIADRGYVLESGKIVLSGTGEELMASDAVKKAYLGG